MQLGSSHEGKPSVRDVCKHLNMAVSQKKGKLNRKTLVENLVEKFMSEIGHVTESASASSGSSGVAPAVAPAVDLENCKSLPWKVSDSLLTSFQQIPLKT